MCVNRSGPHQARFAWSTSSLHHGGRRRWTGRRKARPAVRALNRRYEGASAVSTAPFRSVGKMNLWYTTNFSSQKMTLTTRNAKPTMAR